MPSTAELIYPCICLSVCQRAYIHLVDLPQIYLSIYLSTYPLASVYTCLPTHENFCLCSAYACTHAAVVVVVVVVVVAVVVAVVVVVVVAVAVAVVVVVVLK